MNAVLQAVLPYLKTSLTLPPCVSFSSSDVPQPLLHLVQTLMLFRPPHRAAIEEAVQNICDRNGWVRGSQQDAVEFFAHSNLDVPLQSSGASP